MNGIEEAQRRQPGWERQLRTDIFTAYAKAKVCMELGEEYKEAARQNWKTVAELTLLLRLPEQEDLSMYLEALEMLKGDDT